MPKCNHSGRTLLDDTGIMIQEVSMKLVVFISLLQILCVQCIVCQISDATYIPDAICTPDDACVPDGTKYESTDSGFGSGKK